MPHSPPPPRPSAAPASAADAEELRAAAGGAEKRAYVQRIFSEIAPRYDLLNHLLSLNIDRRWRRAALAALGWQRAPQGRYLDLCAGTLDVAAQLSEQPGFHGRVLAADFAEPMLRAGRAKTLYRPIHPVVADALALPIATGSVDGAVVAFGIRNVADLDAALRELHRALRPGARFVILEFSTPPFRPLRALYHLYFHAVLPAVGRLVSGHPTAYRYLPASVASFPSGDALAARMTRAGFANVHWKPVSFGIAAIHVGERGASDGEGRPAAAEGAEQMAAAGAE